MAASTGPGKPSSRRPGPPGRRGAVRAPGSGGRSGSGQAAPAPRSGTRFTARALLLVVVALALLTAYTQSVHAWWEQRSQIHALEAKNRQAKSDIAALGDQKKRLEDPAYVRILARERFGWVLPGETGYRVIGAGGKVEGNTGSLGKAPTPTTGSWSQKLWSSVEAAGKDS